VSDHTQIPHLLRLIDDESATVRKAAAEALLAFGSSLELALSQLKEPLEESQVQKIRDFLKGYPGAESSAHDAEEDASIFQPGQLVRHRRYNYRGVVVATDLSCQADNDWYFSNRTQPDQGQPWYHVLVHDSDQMTYAAQSSLEEDPSDEQVVHPLVSHFFSDFHDGQYIRNDTPWPFE